MAATGGSGFSLARTRRRRLVDDKGRRMKGAAANGLLVLLPSAYVLASWANAGRFDGGFYALQGVELVAGAVNITLLALNMRDGLLLCGRFPAKRSVPTPGSQRGTCARRRNLCPGSDASLDVHQRSPPGSLLHSIHAACRRQEQQMPPVAPDRPVDEPTPVQQFSNCHGGILSGLRGFAELPALQDAAVRARNLAAETLKLLDHAVIEHHSEEEKELFHAVLRSARPGPELDHVKALVDRLTAEHREVEDAWKRLRPQVQRVASGKPAQLPAGDVHLLVQTYQAHALLEESEFLPLAAEILGRDSNHMAALGLALHMRHAPVPNAYI